MIQIKHRSVKSFITKTKIPAEVASFAVNPYVGCPHKCLYCYACFMKSFTGHTEPWGSLLILKTLPCSRIPKSTQGVKFL